MGVKHLNNYFTTHCSSSAIKKTDFESCRGKTIVVDTSIYLYKFLEKDAFMEQLYLFLALFTHYKIQPIFIFDGKSPPEKLTTIQKRYTEKKQAESRYDEIQIQLLAYQTNSKEYADACKELENLRKKMVRLKYEHVQQAKSLINAFGFTHYDAPGESDQLCAYFVKSGVAWACLSEDMDMFLLDCPRVLRNISLMNHTWTLYNTQHILKDLNISLRDLTEMVILCGSDYNYNKHDIKMPTIKKIFDIYYNEYQPHIEEIKNIEQIEKIEQIQQTTTTFYEWYTKIKENQEIMPTEKMEHIMALFDIYIIANILQPFCDSFCKLADNKMNMKNVQTIMEKYGFIFVL